jgi:hypothetical protein
MTNTKTPYARFFAAVADIENPPTPADLTQIPCPTWCEFAGHAPRDNRFPSPHELPEIEPNGMRSRQHTLTISDAPSGVLVTIVQDEHAETVTGPAVYSPIRIEYTVEHHDSMTPSDVLTGHQARELAAYLVEAAEAWDRLRADSLA